MINTVILDYLALAEDQEKEDQEIAPQVVVAVAFPETILEIFSIMIIIFMEACLIMME
jgi:hypothetical protein